MRKRNEANNTCRETWIDALKGIAICGIIMIHSGGAGMPSILGKIGNIGKNGVQLFFVLSAYLSFLSFEHNVSKNGEQIKCTIKWVLKKFVRLIPLYYLSLFVYGVFVGGNTYWLGNEGHIRVGNVLSHITLTHGFFPHYVNSVIGVEWYLGVLGVFYVIMPLLYKCINSFEKSIIWFCISGFVCLGISLVTIRFIIPGMVDSYIYENYFGTFWFIMQFPVLILGIMLFYIFKSNILDRIKNSRRLLSYTLLIFALCMVGGMALERNLLLGLSSFTLFGMWFVLLALSQKISSCLLIDNKLFAFLGRYSYPIYLFHCALIWIYGMYMPDLTDNYVINWVIEFALIIIASSILAVLLDRFFDIPIVRKLNLLLDKI